MINNVKYMSALHLKEELDEMEDSYGTAFTEGTSADALQLIWDRIRELKNEIERRSRDTTLYPFPLN